MSSQLMTNQELASWLEKLHSHSVYDVAMLSELPSDLAAKVPTVTMGQQIEAMINRGLGGDIDTSADLNQRTFTGYQAAMALTRYRLGEKKAHEVYGSIGGRGSIHRACVAALKESQPDSSPELLLEMLAEYGFEAAGFDQDNGSFLLSISHSDAEEVINALQAHNEYQEAQYGH